MPGGQPIAYLTGSAGPSASHSNDRHRLPLKRPLILSILRPPSMCSFLGAPSSETYVLSCLQLHPYKMPKLPYLQPGDSLSSGPTYSNFDFQEVQITPHWAPTGERLDDLKSPYEDVDSVTFLLQGSSSS